MPAQKSALLPFRGGIVVPHKLSLLGSCEHASLGASRLGRTVGLSHGHGKSSRVVPSTVLHNFRTEWSHPRLATEGGRRLLPAGPEPAVGSATGGCSGWRWPPEVAGRARPQPDRVRDVLEGRARDRDRRAAHRGHRHRGLLPARGEPRREVRARSPRPSAAAVAAQAVDAAGRLPRASWSSSTSSASGSGRSWPTPRPARPAAARPDLGLPARRARRGRSRGRPAEINGAASPGEMPGGRFDGFGEMRADGSTERRLLDLHRASTPAGVNRAAHAQCRVAGAGPDASEWGVGVAANRRILYNRASADPDGKPWSERKKLVWWDEEAGAAGPATTCPTSRSTWPPTTGRARGTGGPDALAGDDPFIMQAGRRRVALRTRGAGGRAAADALRAAGVAGRQPALPASSRAPRGWSSRARTTCSRRPPANPASRSTRTCSPPTGSPSTTRPAA
jgi:hypothetical protein